MQSIKGDGGGSKLGIPGWLVFLYVYSTTFSCPQAKGPCISIYCINELNRLLHSRIIRLEALIGTNILYEFHDRDVLNISVSYFLKRWLVCVMSVSTSTSLAFLGGHPCLFKCWGIASSPLRQVFSPSIGFVLLTYDRNYLFGERSWGFFFFFGKIVMVENDLWRWFLHKNFYYQFARLTALQC